MLRIILLLWADFFTKFLTVVTTSNVSSASAKFSEPSTIVLPKPLISNLIATLLTLIPANVPLETNSKSISVPKAILVSVLTSSVAGSCAIADLSFYRYSEGINSDVNKNQLEALYNNVKDTDTTAYSNATKTAFAKALETAETLLASTTATQGLIDDAHKALFDAKRGLVNVSRLETYKESLEEYKETLPSLGSEESQMYCVCRDRMKKNRTSWSPEGAEAMLKVIMNKMNGTLTEVITNKAKEKILEELSQRIAEPVKVRKIKYNELIYAGKYKIADNFVGGTKKFIIDLLNGKKCSELMLIN